MLMLGTENCEPWTKISDFFSFFHPFSSEKLGLALRLCFGFPRCLQGRSLTRKRNAEGREEKLETLHNLVEGETLFITAQETSPPSPSLALL